VAGVNWRTAVNSGDWGGIVGGGVTLALLGGMGPMDGPMPTELGPLGDEIPASSLAKDRLGDPDCPGCGYTSPELKKLKALVPYYPPNRGFDGRPVKTTLEPGTIVDRYGGTGGSFASPRGTPPWARSLPYGAENRPLNTYEVVKPLEVDAGRAVPWFGQPGGGIQYDFGRSIQELIDSGYLKPLQ